MSYRDDALARLDPLAFFASQGVVLSRLNETEYRFLCPFHDDHEPSANVAVSGGHRGLWSCHACGAGGSPLDFLMLKGRTYKEALADVGALVGMEAPHLNGKAGEAKPAKHKKAPAALSEDNVKAWADALGRNPDVLRWLHEHRGFSDDTIAAYALGWDGQRVTIPIRDEDGRLVNVRRYRDPRAAEHGAQGKMIGLDGINEARLFPLALPLPEQVFLVEGEWDAILARQHGFGAAMTVTSGAGIWKPEFTPLFAGRAVTVCYDNDDAGRKGAQRVASILSAGGATVRILNIPNLPDKGDVTDFFVEQGRSPDELRSLIDDAAPYIAAAEVTEEPDAVKVALHLASHAQYRGKRLEVGVMLSGKAMTPYIVPYEFEFSCGMNNKRYCGACPLLEDAGHKVVRMSASDPAVLGLINVSGAAQYSALRALARGHPQCSYGVVDIKSSVNVEELRLIAELDSGERDVGETEYVNRTGYFIGHGLLPNRVYSMLGYIHPHPKTQATVHVVNEAVPAQDNISAFALTPEIKDRLGMFHVQRGQAVDEKFADIYDDLRRHVHRIQSRPDMQLAYDLVWHSVVDFYFNDAYVRRGWVEAMVMGDSGQGKTEMAMNLLRHYRLGERVQGEQSSVAGLMGGLEKLGDTWMLAWGRLPLNDKRLVIIDETQGLKPEAIESLSDVRATGVAEITKIRTERTHARCRIVWLANPVNGQPLSQHNHGVAAIRDLFKKPEDVRRLDFAITVASADVDFANAINVRHAEGVPLRYDSEACRSLILWAWSRRTDQVRFTPEATDAILSAATRMGRRYHPAIPLVEPADQRIKLARLSAAAAARVHSCDESGEILVVGPEHVDFVVRFLDRIYNSPSMSYGEYSEQVRGAEVMDADTEDLIATELRGWSNSAEALSFFRQATVFKRSELLDVVGWDETYAKAQLKYLAGKRLIRTVRDGYRKNAVFIALLRRMLVEPEQLEVERSEQDPF